MAFWILVVAALGLWSRYTFDDYVGEPQATATEAYQEQHGPAEGYWWPEFSTRDTYAQWAMTILALAATVTGILGVIWIRQTLEATRDTARAAVDAVRATREIGYTQVRAYLGISSLSATIEGELHRATLVIEVHIGNGGQTPARNLSFRGYAFYVGEDETVRSLLIETSADPADLYSATTRRMFFCRASLSASEVVDFEKLRGGFKLAGAVWYTPVAGQQRHYLRYAYALFPLDSLTKNRHLKPIRAQNGNDAN